MDEIYPDELTPRMMQQQSKIYWIGQQNAAHRRQNYPYLRRQDDRVLAPPETKQFRRQETPLEYPHEANRRMFLDDPVHPYIEPESVTYPSRRTQYDEVLVSPETKQLRRQETPLEYPHEANRRMFIDYPFYQPTFVNSAVHRAESLGSPFIQPESMNYPFVQPESVRYPFVRPESWRHLRPESQS